MRKLQQMWRRKRVVRLEQIHKRAEHTATLAILGVQKQSASQQPRFLSSHHSRGTVEGRRRRTEHLALVERVAAQRILHFFRSPAYLLRAAARHHRAVDVQSRVRRYLAWKRFDERLRNHRAAALRR